MPELPGLWSLTPIGFGIGVVALVYWLIATGRLVPRRQHEREIDFRDKIIENQRLTNEKLNEQVTKLVLAATTIQAFLRAAGPDFDEDTEGGAG